jgi:hypothetical protein
MSSPGDFWPLYIMIGIFAAVPVALGPRQYRVFGVVALMLVGSMIYSDYSAGRQFREKFRQNLEDGRKRAL